MSLGHVRWGVRMTLALGIAASIVANILHARPNPISESIAAWPPIALLITIELISRIPVEGRLLAVARVVATVAIASIAGWVSYWHMASVAARYGETGAAPYLMPLSVDGLIMVASVCLVELAQRTRALVDMSVPTVDMSTSDLDMSTVDPAPPHRRGRITEAVAGLLAERPHITPEEVVTIVDGSPRHVRRVLRDLRQSGDEVLTT